MENFELSENTQKAENPLKLRNRMQGQMAIEFIGFKDTPIILDWINEYGKPFGDMVQFI